MTITLSPEVEKMIGDYVASGRYASPSDVLREAMQLLGSVRPSSAKFAITWQLDYES